MALSGETSASDTAASPVPSSEQVTLAGSGLVFNNTYLGGVSAAFRTEIIAAENYLQSQFTDSVTVNTSFDLRTLDSRISGQNSFNPVHISYAAFVTALAAHATPGDADDQGAVASLKNLIDPTSGAGLSVPIGEARILGLAPPGNTVDDSVVLNNLYWTASALQNFPSDAEAVIEHEVTEGIMGRIGHNGSHWGPMDLFRFTASGQRDFTGGSDGQKTYFSTDGTNVYLGLQYHSPTASGTDDGFDWADWDAVGDDRNAHDPFGPGGPGAGDPGTLSVTDLRIMDVLGWTLNPGTISINNVSITEGDSGTKQLIFTVTRTGGTAAFSVHYATADGTATIGDQDYVTNSGKLSFGVGDTTQTIAVTINGDTKVEPDETFSIVLTNATNGATITNGTGIGTIVNDDVVGSISINDVSISEGNSGTQQLVFTVTRSGGSAAFTVGYATADGTATAADSDYLPKSGTLSFANGQNAATISVTVNGDTRFEPNETFSVNLSNATNGGTIGDNTGIGTIVNDDALPVLSIAPLSASKTEGSSGGMTPFTFTVTRTGDASAASAVSWQVNPGASPSADASDFNGATSGMLTFNPGDASKLVTVNVIADATIEPTENFTVALSGASGATIDQQHGSAAGAIVNDDQDLTVPNATIGANAAQTGTPLHVSFDWQFSGDGNAQSWTAGIYLSADPTITTSDLLLGAVPSTSAPNVSGIASLDVTIPHDLPIGTYYAGVIVDNGNQVAESNETNNASSPIQLAVTTNLQTRWIASVDIGAHPAGYVPALTGDFNHDGTSDVLWFDSATGDVDLWKIANGAWAGSVDIGAHPAGYQPAATGDFNGDGTNDVLWYNPASGDVDIWKIANGAWAVSVDVGSHPFGWQPAGSGDFNGDGISDVLWYNAANGDAEIWKISNGQWAGSVDIGVHPLGWLPSGVGDFNHDGRSDVLWYNPDTHDIDLWKISDGHWAGSVDIGAHPAGWLPAGIGDFNTDGTSDVAWFNPSSGDVDIWLIADGHWAGSIDLGQHPPGWSPAGIGDFDHNGTRDVLWRDGSAAQLETWLLAS